MNEWVEKAWQAAMVTRENAHAPYSKFLVGAAVKPVGQDLLITGCNVENGSYGATVCAERVALWRLVAEQGRQAIDFVLVVTDTEPAASPCAQCRQVMAEFAPPDFKVYFANLQGVQKEVMFSDLLPYPFDPECLP
ncbi:MAG: cytidine deaminase [Kiritimatiellia bacterium]|jgi:cytidine deaminase